MQIKTSENRKEIKQHGNYEFPVNVSIESIQAYEQGMFWWHWHPEVELTVILSGEIEYHINDAQYHLKAGDGIFGNSNTLHAGFKKDGKDCTYLSVTFHPRFLYGYAGSILQSKYVTRITEDASCGSFLLSGSCEWQKAILQDLQAIYRMSEDPPEDYELQVHILLMQIWQRIYRYHNVSPDGSGQNVKNMERLRKILTYLQEHYMQEVSLEEISEHVNVCRSECCRFFRRYMKMTIFEYLLYLRIQNSLALLRNGESITNTAQQVGFSSSAYYGQIFRRYMNCTPREYKKKNNG